MPSTSPKAQNDGAVRDVEVTLLGTLEHLKGIQWPDDPDNRLRSFWIEEPCELIVHLPAGRALTMRTRPILIVSRIMPTNVIGSIDAPPAWGERGSLPEKAKEAEQLLSDWNITPNEQMRTKLDEWKKSTDAGIGIMISGLDRGGMQLDEHTRIGFRVMYVGPFMKGGWSLVVEIEATAEEMKRVRQEAEAHNASATQQSLQATEQSTTATK